MSEATPVTTSAPKGVNAPAAPKKKANPKATKTVSEWKSSSPLISCRFDRSGKYLFAGGEDSRIYRFETATGKSTVIAGHESWVRDFAFLKDGKTMVACDYAGRLLWWPIEMPAGAQHKPTRNIEAHDGWTRCVAISPDGKTLATGGNDDLVKTWDAATGKLIRKMEGHPRHVYSVFFHPTENVLLSGDLMGNVKQWDLSNGKAMRAFEAKDLHKYDTTFRADYGGVRSIDLSPDGKHLAFAGLHKCTNAFAGVNQPLVMRFDWQSQQKVQSHATGHRALAWRAMFHPNGFLIAAIGGSAGGYLCFWNDAAKVAHELKMKNIARDMDLHPDGTLIATAHHDSRIRVSKLG